MGPEGAVNIVYRRELDRAAKEGVDGLTGAEAFNKLRAEKIEEFRDSFANPYVAAERGYIHGVIRPSDTRKNIIQALEMLDGKRDKNPAKNTAISAVSSWQRSLETLSAQGTRCEGGALGLCLISAAIPPLSGGEAGGLQHFVHASVSIPRSRNIRGASFENPLVIIFDASR